MDVSIWKNIIDGVANAIGNITAMAVNLKFFDTQKEINRDTELGKTNRSMATNSMLSSAMPVILLIIATLIIFNKQKK
jgi:hypothetical protein